jgi:hypothetical protein
MVDVDTFLTTLYVLVDDLCKTLPVARHPGPAAALSRSEVVTLAIFSQWGGWAGQRAFYRYAVRHLQPAFPHLPHRSQLNRLIRRATPTITACSLHLARLLPRAGGYEVLDTAPLPVRNAKRRGRSWFVGQANIGYSLRLGWYYGFHLLTAVTPQGVLTGWGLAPASAKDQPMAEVFFALRQQPQPGHECVGTPASGPYLADAGFAGRPNHARWQAAYGAQVISPPQANDPQPWSAAAHRWLDHRRQIVETVNDKLLNGFRLKDARLHTLDGLQARLAATAALHNFCCWLNQQLDRPTLAFAELVDW